MVEESPINSGEEINARSGDRPEEGCPARLDAFRQFGAELEIVEAPVKMRQDAEEESDWTID